MALLHIQHAQGVKKCTHTTSQPEDMESIPPGGVFVGALIRLSGGVNGQQHTQHCSVGKVTQTLHGEGKHDLRKGKEIAQTPRKTDDREVHAKAQTVDMKRCRIAPLHARQVVSAEQQLKCSSTQDKQLTGNMCIQKVGDCVEVKQQATETN